MGRDYERTTLIPNYGLTGEFNTETSGQMEYEVIVRSGSGASFYLVEQSEISNYEQGFNFRSYANATHKNVMSVQNSLTIGPGSYGIIIENPTLSNIVVDIHVNLPISHNINLS